MTGKREIFIKYSQIDSGELIIKQITATISPLTVVEHGEELLTSLITSKEWDLMQYGFHLLLKIMMADTMATGQQTGLVLIITLVPIRIYWT